MSRGRGGDEVLAVEADEGHLTVAVLARDGDTLAVRRAATGPASGDLAHDLRQGLAALGTWPRRAILVTPRASAVVLQVPPTAGLGPERMAGLVGYELEPYLPAEEARAPGTAACGWVERNGSSDRAGPMLACGVAAQTRDELARAFRRAGARLEALYPQLACGTALVSGRDTQVVEVGRDRVSAARVAQGVVVRHSVQRAPSIVEQALAVRRLVEPGEALVLVQVGDELRAELDDLGPTTVAALAPPADPGPEAPPAPTVSASLAGAARHALGLSGGERVAAIPAEVPGVPLLRRPAVRAALAGAALIGAALGSALLVGRARDEVATQVVSRERELDLRKQAAVARKALEARRDALSAELARSRASLAALEAQDGRRAHLLALLSAVSSAAPAGLSVTGLHEEPSGAVRVAGIAREPVQVQALVRDLAADPALQGKAPHPAVVRREQGPGPGRVLFEVRFGGVAAPPRPPSSGGD